MEAYKKEHVLSLSKKIEQDAFVALAKSGKPLRFLIAEINQLFVPMVYFDDQYEGVFYEDGCVLGAVNLTALESELNRVAAELNIGCTIELVSAEKQVTIH